MRTPVPHQLDALVVGAGFAGLYQLLRMREAGLRVHVVEAGEAVGGTWYWNRYPGARCDVPSVEYSYSFSPALEQEWRWTERYAAQPEIRAYLQYVAERFGLLDGITFGTRVTSARWQSEAEGWKIQSDRGDVISAKYLILATGALSAPKLPDLPGLRNFAGDVLHTAKWDESVPLQSRRIAVFGTGSSGIQVIPELARVASKLTVFQRTPNFAVPASNHPLSAADHERTSRTLREDRAAARRSALGFFDAPRPGAARDQTPEQRAQRFEEQWGAGTAGVLLAYEDLLFDEKSNAYAADFIRTKIAQLVRNPAKAWKLTPMGYPLGARRTCSEIGFYETMSRDEVELVDVRDEPVVGIDADQIVTTKGRYGVDVMVFATGFDACVGAIRAIDIQGRDGGSLRSEWENGPRSYLGLCVAGFPNLFTITGPGSPSVLSNVVLSIEQHVEWITECISDLRQRGASSIEALPEAEQAWMEHAHEVAHKTLFPRADSWYHGRTKDGRRVFMPYVGGCGPYRDKCDAVRAQGYAGFSIA